MNYKKTKGLGRGLESLLGPRLDAVPVSLDMPAGAAPATADATQPSELPIDALQAGRYQPRTHMDEGALQELAQSIRTQGIMQPILVRPLPHTDAEAADAQPPRWEIIAGERRFRAAQIAGLNAVPVLVREVSDENAAIMALIENMQREGLNPLEEARGLVRLVQEFGLSHDEAAQAVGRSRSAASNLMRLLNLTPPVQSMLLAGDLDMGHARALLSLEAADQIRCANIIAARKLNVRQTEALVKKAISAGEFTAENPAENENIPISTPKENQNLKKDTDFLRIEEMLCEQLGTHVEIHLKKQNDSPCSGEITLSFSDLESFQALITRLRGGTPWEG